MTTDVRRHHTEEDKARLLEAIDQQKLTFYAASKAYGVNETVIARWWRKRDKAGLTPEWAQRPQRPVRQVRFVGFAADVSDGAYKTMKAARVAAAALLKEYGEP